MSNSTLTLSFTPMLYSISPSSFFNMFSLAYNGNLIAKPSYEVRTFLSQFKSVEALEQAFIDQGYDLNHPRCKKVLNDFHFLGVAIRIHNFAMAEYLVNKGVDLNTFDQYEHTPLMLACRNRNDALVHLLLERGADAQIGRCLISKDEKGQIISIKREYPLSVSAERQQRAAVMDLIDHGEAKSL